MDVRPCLGSNFLYARPVKNSRLPSTIIIRPRKTGINAAKVKGLMNIKNTKKN